MVSSFYNTNAVLIAFGICMGVTIGLTIFACQTKIDFTVCAGVLVSLLWSLIIFGFLMIWFRSQALMTFYAWIGAFIFSCFIVVDTQMIVGGKHALQFTPDDYIAAALNLYLDIVNLFLYILRIGERPWEAVGQGWMAASRHLGMGRPSSSCRSLLTRVVMVSILCLCANASPLVAVAFRFSFLLCSRQEVRREMQRWRWSRTRLAH